MSKKPKPRKQRNKPQRSTHKAKAAKKSDVHQPNSSNSSLYWTVGLGIFAIVLTLVFGVPVYFSRIDIEIRDVETLLPLAASFPVTNHGPFAVYSVRLSCHINELVAGGIHIQNVTWGMVPNESQILKSGDPSDVTCKTDIRGVPIDKADIDIAIMYRPKFFPELYFQCAKFLLDSGMTTHPIWRQQPGTNCRDPFEYYLPQPLSDSALFPPVIWFW